ncbi:MAG: hypothetical protein ACK5Z2_01075, partial [Bacteroidota bacterium]
ALPEQIIYTISFASVRLTGLTRTNNLPTISFASVRLTGLTRTNNLHNFICISQAYGPYPNK